MSKTFASKEEIAQVRLAMVMQFPNCFVPKGMAKKPLKIGISADLAKLARVQYPQMSLRLIKSFMSDYLGGANYQKCMVQGAVRVDLDGNPHGVVTESDAAYHAAKLERINNLKKKRSGPKSIGELAIDVVAKTRRKMDALKAEIKASEEAQSLARMSNNFYSTDGSKRKDDAKINALREQLRELERAW